ncbi:MAG: 3-hydroxyacyl-CoA dehydrogenase family protein [Canidatus Methanoxibalbensis ujae]|nr:3-hydroxyacyl-CoA dehydrogenase family protein [Candidatus Methanoxibalbensis ujae]
MMTEGGDTMRGAAGEIRKVCVVGFGVMGRGIVQICAQSGYETSVVARREESLREGIAAVEDVLRKLVKKGRIDEDDVGAALSRIHTTTSIEEGAKDADIVIEAVYEDISVKKEVFEELDNICPPHTILGSNTSTISIAMLGAVTKRPDKVIGVHFMNPPPVIPAVEIVRSLKTSEETVRRTIEFVRSLGKETVTVKDSPGFVTSRMMVLMLNEAVKIAESNIASVEDIDKVIRLSFGWPMGPFQLLDLIGVDVVANALNAIYEETGWERFKPAVTMVQMARVGWKGRKTGKGFYDYRSA